VANDLGLEVDAVRNVLNEAGQNREMMAENIWNLQ